MLRLKNLKVKKYAKAIHNSWGALMHGVLLKSDDGESGAGIEILRMLERANWENKPIIISCWCGGKPLVVTNFATYKKLL